MTDREFPNQLFDSFEISALESCRERGRARHFRIANKQNVKKTCKCNQDFLPFMHSCVPLCSSSDKSKKDLCMRTNAAKKRIK